MKNCENEEFICPFCLAQELAKYSFRDRIKIWKASRHLIKFHKLVEIEEALTEDELLDEAFEELKEK